MEIALPVKVKRDSFIDVMKGVGIALVVIGHSGFEYRNIIYLFHMALFFIISGYCYRVKKNSIKIWITKKLKALWIPNFVSVVFVSLMSDVLLNLHIVSADAIPHFTIKGFGIDIIKACLFSGGRELLGANWFLRTLFLGLLLYELLNRLLVFIKADKWLLRVGICIFFLITGWLVTMLFGMGMYFNFLSVPVLIETGRYIKDKNLIVRYRKFHSLICGVVLLAGLILLSFFGAISMNYNVIVDPMFFMLCSLLGFFLCVSVADLFFRLNWTNKIFAYMGKHSLAIMLMHFASFKVVTLLQILLFSDSIEKLTSNPVYISSYGWWIVYSVVGIAIPCLMTFIWSILKNKMMLHSAKKGKIHNSETALSSQNHEK